MNKNLIYFIVGGLAIYALVYFGKDKSKDVGLDEPIIDDKESDLKRKTTLNDGLPDEPLQPCPTEDFVFQQLYNERKSFLTSTLTGIEGEVRTKESSIKPSDDEIMEMKLKAKQLVTNCRKANADTMRDFKNNGVEAPSKADEFLKNLS
jgi:ElaB/YqjD/DUF883 family membrane-anchored ribosome-binding protein